MLYTQDDRDYYFHSFQLVQKNILEEYFKNVYTVVAED